MMASENPTPASTLRVLTIKPPCHLACECSLCEKNGARGVGRKTRRKYHGGGEMLGPFCTEAHSRGTVETARRVVSRPTYF